MGISDWSSDVGSSDLAGGETGIILVKGGLEREAARRAEEMDEHGERPPAEIERPHIEPAGFGRGGKDGAKPGLGLAVAGERRSRAPLPAARLDRKSTRLNSSH